MLEMLKSLFKKGVEPTLEERQNDVNTKVQNVVNVFTTAIDALANANKELDALKAESEADIDYFKAEIEDREQLKEELEESKRYNKAVMSGLSNLVARPVPELEEE